MMQHLLHNVLSVSAKDTVTVSMVGVHDATHCSLFAAQHIMSAPLQQWLQTAQQAPALALCQVSACWSSPHSHSTPRSP